DMESIVVQDLAKIGIGVVPRELETGAAYQTIQTVKNDIPIALNAGWGKDYADPYTFAEPLFSSSSIIPSGNVNNSLVGLTRSQARSLALVRPPRPWPCPGPKPRAWGSGTPPAACRASTHRSTGVRGWPDRLD